VEEWVKPDRGARPSTLRLAEGEPRMHVPELCPAAGLFPDMLEGVSPPLFRRGGGERNPHLLELNPSAWDSILRFGAIPLRAWRDEGGAPGIDAGL